MGVIETEFDGILDEDVILEEVDTKLLTKEILASAENIYKANLYLRELYTQAPTFNEVVKFDTLETSDYEEYTLDEKTNLIVVKNLRDSESKVKLNGVILVLLPFENFEFPIAIGSKLELLGRVSIIQTKYN